MTRDFAAEIMSAVASNDVQSLGKLAIELLGMVSADAARREKQASKKRRQRGTTGDMQGQPGTTPEKGGFPPDPLSSKKQPAALHRAREAGLKVEMVDSDGVPLAEVEAIDEALVKFAGLFPVAWPAASRFLSRRPLRTWMGWMRQMRKDVGPGSQFTEEDLATVCDHDEALERPIGSPLGLTSFLGKAKQQRMTPPDVRPITDARKGATVSQRTLDAGRKALGLD